MAPASFRLTSENWQSVSRQHCINKQGMAENFADCQTGGQEGDLVWGFVVWVGFFWCLILLWVVLGFFFNVQHTSSLGGTLYSYLSKSIWLIPLSSHSPDRHFSEHWSARSVHSSLVKDRVTAVWFPERQEDKQPKGNRGDCAGRRLDHTGAIVRTFNGQCQASQSCQE